MLAGGKGAPPLSRSHRECLACYRTPCRDPFAHAGGEEVERNRAGAEHHVVEVDQVEAGAKRPFGLAAELPHLQLPDLVGHGLAGPCDVAVNLVYDVMWILRGVFHEVVDRALPVPTEGVDSGINYQTDCAPHIVC